MNKTDMSKKYFLSESNLSEFERWADNALGIAEKYLLNQQREKLHSDITLPELEKIFSQTQMPETSCHVEDVFQEAVNDVMSHSVRVADPYFIGHMTSSTPIFSMAIEILIAALNQNVVKIETARSASFVERQTIAWMHRLIYNRDDGYYKAWIHNPVVALGNVTTGGTLGNVTALTVARNRALKDVARNGMVKAMRDGGYDRTVVIASKRVHYSMKKAASLLGIGQDNVLEIPVDPHSNRISIPCLENTLVELRAQKTLIIALVGIAGSTETGSVDDLQALAEIAHAHNIWFHVDAAWGGAVLLSEKYKKRLQGIERADSVVMDGHKLFYLTMSHGIVLFKDKKSLEFIQQTAKYIIRKGSVDLGRTTLEGSRRFDSFKLWFCLKTLGRKGYEELIDNSVELAHTFASKISTHPVFEQTSDVELNILTYRFVPPSWKAGLQYLRATRKSTLLLAKNLTESTQLAEELNEMRECMEFATYFLNLVNVELQKRQRQQGKSFVSRTTLESVDVQCEAVVLRAIPFNPLTTPLILDDILLEQATLGRDISRQKWNRLKTQKPRAFLKYFPSL